MGRSLFHGDSIFLLTVQTIDDQSQQFLEFIMDQRYGFHNLLVVQFLGQNTCGHIGNAGNAHHIHTAVRRNDGFRHRGHTDGICAHHPEHPDFCLFLSKKSVDHTNNFTKNLCYSLETRLANFILITSHNGIYREKHTEVAEYLGVTYRHLLYVLAKFVKSGIIEKSEQGYVIKNKSALRKISTMDKGT